MIWIRPRNALEDMTWHYLKTFHWIALRTAYPSETFGESSVAAGRWRHM